MDPLVTAALIGGAATAVPATIAAVATWRKIGSPNGHKTLARMVEHVLENQGAQAEQIAGIHTRLDRLENQP